MITKSMFTLMFNRLKTLGTKGFSANQSLPKQTEQLIQGCSETVENVVPILSQKNSAAVKKSKEVKIVKNDITSCVSLKRYEHIQPHISITNYPVKKTSLNPKEKVMTKYFTLLWGVIAILFACVGTLFENLIQLVNIVGSIFYGTVLGIFLVGFYIKFIKAHAIFYSALLSQSLIFYIYYLDVVSFLWLNFIGALLTILFSTMVQVIVNSNNKIA